MPDIIRRSKERIDLQGTTEVASIDDSGLFDDLQQVNSKPNSVLESAGDPRASVTCLPRVSEERQADLSVATDDASMATSLPSKKSGMRHVSHSRLAKWMRKRFGLETLDDKERRLVKEILKMEAAGAAEKKQEEDEATEAVAAREQDMDGPRDEDAHKDPIEAAGHHPKWKQPFLAFLFLKMRSMKAKACQPHDDGFKE